MFGTVAEVQEWAFLRLFGYSHQAPLPVVQPPQPCHRRPDYRRLRCVAARLLPFGCAQGIQCDRRRREARKSFCRGGTAEGIPLESTLYAGAHVLLRLRPFDFAQDCAQDFAHEAVRHGAPHLGCKTSVAAHAAATAPALGAVRVLLRTFPATPGGGSLGWELNKPLVSPVFAQSAEHENGMRFRQSVAGRGSVHKVSHIYFT